MKNNNLRALRKRAGYHSASAFATALGKPLSTVTSHENGSRTINDDYLKIYSDFLNVSSDVIVKRDTLIVHDRFLDVVYYFCAVQRRNNNKFSKEFISDVIYKIERNNINNFEIELFVESCLIDHLEQNSNL